jgi:hypothetical protein
MKKVGVPIGLDALRCGALCQCNQTVALPDGRVWNKNMIVTFTC